MKIAIRVFFSSLLRAIIERNQLPFFKIFLNCVHFCPNFQIFCPFFALFLKNRTCVLTFQNRPWQCKLGLVYKVLYFRMLILIFLVYVLSGYTAITTTYSELLGTYTELKKQHIYSMNQHVKILQTSCFATFGSSACRGNFS